MLSIVVPTYCEADNLVGLAESIREVLQKAGIPYELIIADDNSPDHTAAVCEALSNEHPLSLLTPQNRDRDLSLSVIDGLRAARFESVVVMDADHSHPPEKLPEMLAALHEHTGHMVVGSRYVDDGSFDRDWSLWRFVNSRVATLLTMPLVDCLDPMSGFFAVKTSDLGDLDSLRPIGYKIGLELMVRGNFAGVHEVPINFRDREIGESKMNFTQQINFLRHLRRLYTVRFGGWAEFINYGMVGASGFVVDLIFYLLLQLMGISHQVARGLSFWPAVTWNWLLNRSATFGERKRRSKGRQWLEFVVVSLVGFTINWGVYVLLTGQVGFFNDYRILAFLTGIVAASGFNFAMSTLFVYSEKRI